MDKRYNVTFPELGILAVTRGLIGLGAGLLLANKISRAKRKAIGLPLFVGGVLSTIPIAMHIFNGKAETSEGPPPRV